MRNPLLAFGILSLFLVSAAPAAMAQNNAKAKSPAAAKPATPANEADLLGAARRGDQAAMRLLTGTKVTLSGKTRRTLRVTGDYTDVLLVTGPDFKLWGGQSGLEVVIRVPNNLFPKLVPEQITAYGTLTEFQQIAETTFDERGPEEVAWTPIFTVSFLK